MKLINPFKKIIGPPDRCYRADIFCDDEQEEYVQLECGSELAGIVALALLRTDVEVDIESLETYLEDPDWWDARFADSPVSAFLILETRGEKPPGTPTEEDGFGLQTVQRTGDDNELTFDATGVMANRNFIAGANRRSRWDLVYVTAGRDSDGNFEAFYVENVSFYASVNVPRSIKSRKHWTGSVKWSSDMTPEVPFYAPASIFTLSE